MNENELYIKNNGIPYSNRIIYETGSQIRT